MSAARRNAIVAVGVVSVAVGAVAVWRGVVAPPAKHRSSRAPLKLPPELEPLVTTSAPPDPFSDDLASVLASIKKKESRRHVLSKPENMRMLWARATAAEDNQEQFQGRLEEVDIAFPELEKPLPALTEGKLSYDTSKAAEQAAWRRSLSLNLLRFAVASGAPFDREVTDRIADLAVKHLRWSHPIEELPIHLESVAILLFLDNRGALSAERRKAMLHALQHDPLIKPFLGTIVEMGAKLPPELEKAASPAPTK